MTHALAPDAVVGACTANGMAAVLLLGTDTPLTARPHAVVDVSKPLPEWAETRLGRQDTPQHDLRKFAYKNRIAATRGAAAGPHPAWDPV